MCARSFYFMRTYFYEINQPSNEGSVNAPSQGSTKIIEFNTFLCWDVNLYIKECEIRLIAAYDKLVRWARTQSHFKESSPPSSMIVELLNKTHREVSYRSPFSTLPRSLHNNSSYPLLENNCVNPKRQADIWPRYLRVWRQIDAVFFGLDCLSAARNSINICCTF